MQLFWVGRVLLLQDCSYSKLRCIHFQLKLAVLVWCDEDGRRGNDVDKGVKGDLAFWGPFEGCHGLDTPSKLSHQSRLGIAASYVICLGTCICRIVTR